MLFLGTRKSGKTYNMLALLKLAFERNIFQQYILCLPAFDFEQEDAYRFVRDYQKKNKNVKIFDKYSYLITRELLSNAKKSKGRTFIFIDDASLSASSIYEPSFFDLIALLRHLKITLAISYHSLTSGKTLAPFVRSNISYLLLYKIVSEDLLRMIYDEYLSLVDDFANWKDFRKQYLQHIHKEEFSSMILDTQNDKYDLRLKQLATMLKKRYSSG